MPRKLGTWRPRPRNYLGGTSADRWNTPIHQMRWMMAVSAIVQRERPGAQLPQRYTDQLYRAQMSAENTATKLIEHWDARHG